MTERPVVLIVDDVPENLVAFEAMLRRSDVEIVTAHSGFAALEVLLERDVALVLLDVHMPEMDGFAVAELLRGVERTRCVPIIFVTAESRDMSRVFKGYEAGAVDFLFKPVDPQILRGKVDVFVTLERQRLQLVGAERMREMFLGILGHDLRNPLSSILMAAQFGLDHTHDEAVRDALDAIVQSGARMARLIAQLLDLTRVRLGGGISLTLVPADLRRIAEQAVQELPEHRARFSIAVDGSVEGTWDVDRLAQVVSNLAGNAAENSPPGTALSIRVDGTRAESVALEVHNPGPAIPDDLRESLFEPFRGRKREGGLGLGLFICKEFVQAHGGTIEVESSDDSGTTFRVRLPRHSRAAEPG